MELLSKYGRETVQNLPQIEIWKKFVSGNTSEMFQLSNILQILKNYWKVEGKEEQGFLPTIQ